MLKHVLKKDLLLRKVCSPRRHVFSIVSQAAKSSSQHREAQDSSTRKNAKPFKYISNLSTSSATPQANETDRLPRQQGSFVHLSSADYDALNRQLASARLSSTDLVVCLRILYCWPHEDNRISKTRLIDAAHALNVLYGNRQGYLREALLRVFRLLINCRMNHTAGDELQFQMSQLKFSPGDRLPAEKIDPTLLPFDLVEAAKYIRTSCGLMALHSELMERCFRVLSGYSTETNHKLFVTGTQMFNNLLTKGAAASKALAYFRWPDLSILKDIFEKLILIEKDGLIDQTRKCQKVPFCSLIWAMVVTGFSVGREKDIWRLIAPVFFQVETQFLETEKLAEQVRVGNNLQVKHALTSMNESSLDGNISYETRNKLRVRHSELTQLVQIYVGLKSTCTDTQLYLPEYLSAALRSINEVNQVLVTCNKTQNLAISLLRAKLPVISEAQLDCGVLSDGLILPFTPNSKEQFIANLLGSRGNKYSVKLKAAIDNLYIPFKNEDKKGIVIEIDGSHHFIENIGLDVFVPSNIVKAQNSTSFGMVEPTLLDGDDIQKIPCYISGPTMWKRNLILKANYELVSLIFEDMIRWRRQKRLSEAILESVPIHWHNWNAQIASICELHAFENRLNLK